MNRWTKPALYMPTKSGKLISEEIEEAAKEIKEEYDALKKNRELNRPMLKWTKIENYSQSTHVEVLKNGYTLHPIRKPPHGSYSSHRTYHPKG